MKIVEKRWSLFTDLSKDGQDGDRVDGRDETGEEQDLDLGRGLEGSREMVEITWVGVFDRAAVMLLDWTGWLLSS